VALQGDLQSFPLPDVLRLLAGTGKTGRLGVSADSGGGDVWLQSGQVVGGSVSSAPHAGTPADVLFELLRLDGGSFEFEDDAAPDQAGDPASVDEAIEAAQAQLDEWHEVEAVVPSVHSWVGLKPELDGDQTTVTADQWRALAALGGGASVRDLGNRFSLTDLAASRQVKDLVESGLVELGEARDTPTPPPPAAPTDDLAVLRADDGPVVLESRDDALLPEPLPSESTSFAGELDDLSGSVDGRAGENAEADIEADIEAEADAEVPEAAPAEAEAPANPSVPMGEADRASYDAFLTKAAEPPPAAAEAAPADGPEASLGEPDPAEEAAWSTFANGDTMVDHLAEAAPEASPAGAEAAPAEGDSDRGSLLKFLSTVKN
jgi:hypothetical protein